MSTSSVGGTTSGSSIGTGILSSTGIGSGLDVNSIISQLMTVEQQPISLLQQKEASYQTELTAWGTVKGALSTFQSAVEALNDPTKFQATTANVADTTVAAASASGTAGPGNYSLSVAQLAQAQKVYSAGLPTSNTTVGTGTLTFQFGTFDGTTFTPGSQGAKTVTIGANQSSLASIRDAINAANVGVTATIVNDGSASGNRLVLTGANGGAANAFKVSVSDGDGNNTDASGLSQLAYDPAATAGSGKNLSQAIAAQDAKFTVDGIAFSKTSNSVTDAIPGVTLNLSGTTANGASTTISVSRDTTTVSKNVQSFVDAYNTLRTAITSVDSYDAGTQTAGPLFGDTGLQLLQQQISNVIGGTIGTSSANLTNLSQIGIAFQKDGTLALDSTKLSAALSSNFSQVAGLFASQGSASDAQIQYVSAGSGASPGTYPISISALATQGTLVGQAAAGLTITAGVNDQLSVSVDGHSSTVTIPAGTYASADALAAQVQSSINGDSTLSAAGSAVTVSQNNGVLTLTSNRYGSASTVSVGGNAASNLIGASPTATAGTDVAGWIGGKPATGSGQTLTAASGGGTDGIKVTVAGGATGARGSVTMSQGYAAQLDSMVTQMLSSNGPIQASTDSINTSTKNVQSEIDAMNQRLTLVQATYQAQFSALDTLMASMNSTSSFLTQQITLMQKNSA